MRHIFLSPHPDDAIWSCGGYIAKLRAEKTAVLLITLFDGDIPQGLTFSAIPPEEQWRLSAAPSLRRWEDRQAAAFLDITRISLKLPDAAFRQLNSHWIYPSPRHLKQCHAECQVRILPLLSAKLHRLIRPEDIIYGPLGRSSHADHILTRQAFESLPNRQKYIYAEFPYGLAGDFPPTQAIHYHPVNFTLWLAAAQHYESQITRYFYNFAQFQKRLHDFARHPTINTEKTPAKAGVTEGYFMRLTSANAEA